MTPSRPPIARQVTARTGFTLVEMLATLAVVGVVAAITSPIVVNATHAFAKSAAQRRGIEHAAAALDRLSRVLREAPAKASPPGATDFTAASALGFTLSNGTAVALDGSTLTLAATGVTAAPLCRNVTAFQITYLDSSGAPISIASGADAARRVIIRLAAGGLDLSTSVWLRASLNES